MLPILSLLIPIPGIQTEVSQDWLQVQKPAFKAASFPPISKNNPQAVVCEFTGTLSKGVFIESAQLPGHKSDNFPDAWFKGMLKSIHVPNQPAKLKGRFQLRFCPISQAVTAAEPITLWFKK